MAPAGTVCTSAFASWSPHALKGQPERQDPPSGLEDSRGAQPEAEAAPGVRRPRPSPGLDGAFPGPEASLPSSVLLGPARCPHLARSPLPSPGPVPAGRSPPPPPPPPPPLPPGLLGSTAARRTGPEVGSRAGELRTRVPAPGGGSEGVGPEGGVARADFASG